MWETQAGKFTTSKKVNLDFCLPEFSAIKTVTCKCHADDSTNGRYGIILGRYLLTALVPALNFSDNVIIGGEGPYEGCSAPMDEIRIFDFKSITDREGFFFMWPLRGVLGVVIL